MMFYRSHPSAVMTVKWSPSSDYVLASGDREGHLLLWDVRRAKNCLRYFDFNCISRKYSKEIHSNSNKRISVQIPIQTPHKRRKQNHSTYIESYDNSESVNNISKKNNHTDMNIPIAHNGAVNGLSFSDDGKHLISFGCHDGCLLYTSPSPRDS